VRFRAPLRVEQSTKQLYYQAEVLMNDIISKSQEHFGADALW
jgi:hypothetical protein